jgi:hypothetical protein
METEPLFNSRRPLSKEKQAEADRLMKHIFGDKTPAKSPAPEKTKAPPTPAK